jgi:hypothetical protein
MLARGHRAGLKSGRSIAERVNQHSKLLWWDAMPLDDTPTTNVASATLYWRAQRDGLTDGDLRRRSMPPSTLSLLGVVRHMAEVERTWFRRVISREDIPLVWSDEGDL